MALWADVFNIPQSCGAERQETASIDQSHRAHCQTTKPGQASGSRLCFSRHCRFAEWTPHHNRPIQDGTGCNHSLHSTPVLHIARHGVIAHRRDGDKWSSGRGVTSCSCVSGRRDGWVRLKGRLEGRRERGLLAVGIHAGGANQVGWIITRESLLKKTDQWLVHIRVWRNLLGSKVEWVLHDLELLTWFSVNVIWY
jgi:hypothetical protein